MQAKQSLVAFLRGIVALAAFGLAGSLAAQPADLPVPPARTTDYPPGVSIARVAPVSVYTDQRGLTLYGMDMRTVLRWSPDPALYCQAECQAEWEPLLAPPGTTPNIAFPRGFGPPQPPAAGMFSPQSAPDWTVIAGPNGPQWVYKGWHVVYTRRGEVRGAPQHDGADGRIWNTLKFVPPVPTITAPPGVQAVFRDGAYVLSDAEGNVLVKSRCSRVCPGLVPLRAGMASRGLGRWQVVTTGDVAQWAFGGVPVYSSSVAELPRGATLLRADEVAGEHRR